MLQAAASEHVAGYAGLYHFDISAEGVPAIQTIQSILNGHFGSKASKASKVSKVSKGSKSKTTSTRDTKTCSNCKTSSECPKSKVCALLMERFEYSLHELTCFNFLEAEALRTCFSCVFLVLKPFASFCFVF